MQRQHLRQVKAVIFDWDGTLMDSVDRIVASMQAASSDVGITVPTEAEVKEIIGLGLQEALLALFPDQQENIRTQLTERYRQHFVYDSNVETKLFLHSAQTLQTLADAGYKLAVATGKARRGLDKVLEETRLHSVFDVTRCADETRSKPHPQMLNEILNHLSLEPHQAVMVGDTEFDLAMASAIGMPSIGVSYGVHSRERLMSHDPIVCLDDIKDIVHWLPLQS